MAQLLHELRVMAHPRSPAIGRIACPASHAVLKYSRSLLGLAPNTAMGTSPLLRQWHPRHHRACTGMSSGSSSPLRDERVSVGSFARRDRDGRARVLILIESQTVLYYRRVTAEAGSLLQIATS